MAKLIFHDPALYTIPISNYWVTRTSYTLPATVPAGKYRCSYEGKGGAYGLLQVTHSVNGTFQPPNLILEDGAVYCPSCRESPRAVGDGFYYADRDLSLKGGDKVEWVTAGISGKSGWLKNCMIMEAPAAPPPEPPPPEPPEPPPTPPPGPDVPVISAVILLIASGFTAIAGWFFDIANRMKTVWWVGDIIGDWFEYIAHVLEAIEDAFEGVADWTTEVVTILAAKVEESVDFLARIVGLENWREGVDTALTWVQGLYNDFSGAVTNVLGGTWTWLQGLYNDFSGAVTDVLGGTWTWVQSLYNDFSGAVFDVLGQTWLDLEDMHTNFRSWVTRALGGTWTWLTEFVNDPMSKLSLDLLELVKSGFEWLTQEWFSFIDTSWDTFKGSFEWLLQKLFLLLDESWDNFEDTLKWFLGRCMDLVGMAAEDLKYQIWDMVEKVMKKL